MGPRLTGMALTKDHVAQFEQDGYLVVPDFISDAECLGLREHAAKLEEQLRTDHEHVTVFSTGDQAHGDDEWFLSSGDKTRGFFEDDGTHLNKIGHAMHDLDPVFSRFSRQLGLAEAATAIGFDDPRLVQSMYIFKHPGVGGEVTWHTDHTFLWTEPASVVGFWVAIDEATQDNGCLWVIPGGHKIPVKSRFVRHGDTTTTEVFDSTPYPIDQAVAVPAKRGTLVLLHGLLPHWSDVNTSDRPRQAYTLHVVDGAATWDQDNWLQRPTMAFAGFRAQS